jgi:hypothetical protein
MNYLAIIFNSCSVNFVVGNFHVEANEVMKLEKKILSNARQSNVSAPFLPLTVHVNGSTFNVEIGVFNASLFAITF